MKLIRFGEACKERPGIIKDEKWYDVSGFVKDYDEAFFASDGIQKLQSFVEQNSLTEVAANQRLGCPVDKPSKVICIGLNYAQHARETNAQIPKEPILFFKLPLQFPVQMMTSSFPKIPTKPTGKWSWLWLLASVQAM